MQKEAAVPGWGENTRREMNMYGITTVPLEARILYRKGLDLSDQQKDEAAVRYLRQAIIIAPRFFGAYQALGICLSRLGREQDAADCRYRLAAMAAAPAPGRAQAGA
ncbi:hypothetical protein [Methanoregula sp.]|uniref:hypothetical protein n=1 Tax=Methanoregula sp. TaxID=2052170 RepID=UPI000CB14B56|nr:hypothetical protein [Methanoregula sp.]PKG33146.1 MAG: hypothetical protein CW742_04450 [Methanoregula sp.]